MTNDDVSYGGRECEWRVGRAVDGLPVAASRRALGRSWGRSGLGLGRLPLPFCVLRVHLQPYRTLTLYIASSITGHSTVRTLESL